MVINIDDYVNISLINYLLRIYSMCKKMEITITALENNICF